ncbi:prepilin-type N-terminal cleavage/methylation domain-containing protein [Methylopila sp. M107]|uniref:prepilin-type N-terminal cleavage/methylation domain-containing protein n=1 Tax=Methylopila sp. M107 TaxID=1101190 RepID=UPI00037148F2|nr:prepilin-type N-terminal cleavage/methylation domain-containing protein [Methylopila sp. M107]
MSRRRARGGRRAGFTLIETLVALIVFAVVAVVAQRGIVTARLGLDRARSVVAAEQVARSIVETELGRLAPEPGEVSGETDGLAWTVTAEPLPLPLPPAPPPKRRRQGAAQDPQDVPAPGQRAAPEPDLKWRLLRVVVTVANGRGRPFVVETVQVARDKS